MKTQESTKNNILNKALKDKHEKQELNMIVARNNKEHSTMISMKTMSILGKSGACFYPKQGMLGSNLLWTANKTKTKQTKK